MCNKGFISNPSNSECECNKSCAVREYLNYKNCKCTQRLIDNLIKECSENIDGNEMIYNNYRKVRNSCTICIILLVIACNMICISSAFIYLY